MSPAQPPTRHQTLLPNLLHACMHACIHKHMHTHARTHARAHVHKRRFDTDNSGFLSLDEVGDLVRTVCPDARPVDVEHVVSMLNIEGNQEVWGLPSGLHRPTSAYVVLARCRLSSFVQVVVHLARPQC